MQQFKIETVDRVSEREPGELHAVGKNSEGAKGEIPLVDVRGAISPPAADVPGYWLLLGAKYGTNENGKPVRMFLKEGESKNHRRLLDDFAEAAAKYRVREIYCPENTGHFSSMVDKFYQVQGVFVRPAPNESDVDFGVSLVIEALEDKTLEISGGTTIRGQLEQMTADNLGYTLHALRYLLAGFSLYHTRRSAGPVKKADYFYG